MCNSMKLTSKLPNLSLTIFSEMTQLADTHGAINLSQGFPDYAVPAELPALVAKYMQQGHNQYAPMLGVQSLREQIAVKVLDLYGAHYDPASEITVTSGATEALFAAITAVVRTGDEVIVLEPAYDSYTPVISLCGGVPVYVQMEFPDYHIAWQEVRDAITDRTRAIILNSPHNPTGAVLTREDIASLTEIVQDTNIVIISDEVYEHIIFDHCTHQSMASYPQLAARSFVISSFGKTYHATGWKIGYCLAPVDLSKEIQKIHQYLTFASNTPVQHAFAEYMQKKEVYLGLPEFYQQKRDKFLEAIRESRFKALPCKGTYFQMLDYSEITAEPDLEFARRLTADFGVAAIPPSVFYHRKMDYKVLRFCFAKKDETLQQAGEKLCRV